VAPVDPDHSDGLAEAVLNVAPETDMAYEQLLQNARQRRDQNAIRRIRKLYTQAAAQHGFAVSPYFNDDSANLPSAAARQHPVQLQTPRD
jgi:hypothetical protein